MRISLVLFGVFLGVALASCGTASNPSPNPLDKYSEHMNPLLSESVDLYSQDLSRVLKDIEAELLNQRVDPSFESLVQYSREGADELEVITNQMSGVMIEWTVLDPPEEARRFHSLTFEMMQLRYNGVQTMRGALIALSFGQTDSFLNAGLEASDLFDQSDRLLINILEEARGLGEVAITR